MGVGLFRLPEAILCIGAMGWIQIIERRQQIVHRPAPTFRPEHYESQYILSVFSFMKIFIIHLKNT